MKKAFNLQIVRLLSITALAAASLISVSAQVANARGSSGAEAVFEEGFRLFNGYGNPAEVRMKGWGMMLEAAAGGDLHARIQVADYASGHLTVNAPPGARDFFKPDLPRALDFYRNAAAAGNSHAMARLALLYSSRVGEPRHSDETPQALLLASAKKGNQDAMLLLGERYLYGHGVPRDFFEAARWHHLGSRNKREESDFLDVQGHPKVQDSKLLHDFARIYSLYIRTVDQNDPAAKAELERLRDGSAKGTNSAP